MSQYTGTFFAARVQVLLGESRSTAAQQQSMLYPFHMQDTANEIAWSTYALYGHVATNLVAGTPAYTMPYAAKEIRWVSVVDTAGNVKPLQYGTATEMNQIFRDQWNENTNIYAGSPEYYLVENMTQINLFPVANYPESQGLIISSYMGVGSWWDTTTNCPLPDWANEMMTNGIAYRRCKEMAASDDSGKYAKLLPVYQSAYMDELKAKAQEVQKTTDWRRGGPPPSNGTAGASFGTGWNWWS